MKTIKNKKYLSAEGKDIYLNEIKGHIDDQPLTNLLKLLERWENNNYYSIELETEKNSWLLNHLLETIKDTADYEKRRDLYLSKGIK